MLAAGSSIVWGTGDFLAGLIGRRTPVLTVAGVSQATSLVICALVVGVLGLDLPTGSDLAYTVAAGVVGASGLLALYRALSIGIMSIAAPISALAAVVPFVWGMLSGESPETLQVVGALTALSGAVLAAREPSHAPVTTQKFRESVIYALISAVLLGMFLVLFSKAASSGALPVIAVERGVATALIVPLAIAARQMPAPSLAIWGPLIGIGILDTLANVLYISAYQQGGLLAITGLLASLYPVTTVVLAQLVLSERMERHQAIGVLIALLGVAMVSVAG